PLSYLSRRTQEFAWLLVPIGLIAGAVLALVLLRFARQHSGMPTVIRNGLKRREFFLEYQPIVALATGEVVGAEALLRWRRPDGTLVAPDLFIPIAESAGLIGQISARVLSLLAEEAEQLFHRFPDFHL